MKTILFFGTLALFFSCNAQSTSPVERSTLNDQRIAAGDTVSEIDKRISAIFQDTKGNFWFGSNGQGAYRYDGKTIIHFSTKAGLCNNQVRSIQEDKSGNLYLNTDGGISKFDGRTFTTLSITKSNHRDAGWRLHPDDLWFQCAQDSGVVYRYDGTVLHRLQFPKTAAGEDFIAAFPRSRFPQMTFSPYDVYSIFYKDRKGNLWFGTNIGLCRYDGKTFVWISEKELGIDAIAFHVRSIIEDKDGLFWFTNSRNRFAVSMGDPAKNEKVISLRKEKGMGNSKEYDADDFAYFLSSIVDNNGDLWVVTYNKGVRRYSGANITQYQIKEGDENVTLFTIYKDRQGGLWLGAHTAGVYKFDGKNFEQFRP